MGYSSNNSISSISNTNNRYNKNSDGGSAVTEKELLKNIKRWKSEKKYMLPNRDMISDRSSAGSKSSFSDLVKMQTSILE